MPPEARPRTADPMAELKQRARWRLLGALVFLGLASALSLQILRDRPRPLAHDFVLHMPPVPSAEGEVVAAPASGVLSGVSSGGPSGVSSGAASGLASLGSAPAVVPGLADPPAASVPAAKPSVEAKTEPKAWLVQVGAYGNEKTAKGVAKRLASAGPTDVSPVKTAGGTRWRVRVGPFTRADAETFRDKAKSQRYDAILVKAAP